MVRAVMRAAKQTSSALSQAVGEHLGAIRWPALTWHTIVSSSSRDELERLRVTSYLPCSTAYVQRIGRLRARPDAATTPRDPIVWCHEIWRPGRGIEEMRRAGWLPDDVASIDEEVDAGHE